jgi:hypothetical protein
LNAIAKFDDRVGDLAAGGTGGIEFDDRRAFRPGSGRRRDTGEIFERLDDKHRATGAVHAVDGESHCADHHFEVLSDDGERAAVHAHAAGLIQLSGLQGAEVDADLSAGRKDVVLASAGNDEAADAAGGSVWMISVVGTPARRWAS